MRPRWPPSFRWRLTLTYAALLGLTLLVVGLSSYGALRQTLYAGLDDVLRTSAQHLAAQESNVRADPPPQVSAVLDAINRRQPIRMTIYDGLGQEVDWGPSRVGFVSAPGPAQKGSERIFMLKTSGGWIQTTQSDQELRSALWRILRLGLLSLPLLLLAVLGVGYLLADRALRPVDQVSDLAARIARSGHPGERVPQAAGHDELARLTHTINEMLGRLDEQLARERLFAHASAHELRTPISVVRAAASLALAQDRTPQQYRAVLCQVLAVSEDMSALTTRLLALAQATVPADPTNVNLADVTLMAAEAQTTAAQRALTRIEVKIQNSAVSGDFTALVLAAGNLIQNAVRYSPPGSVVLVSCEMDAQQARLSVQDQGPGIPEAEVARLVQPFQRGPNAQQTAVTGGAGLGLALVQAITEAHGGKLTLTNAPGGGLRAELVLPRIG